MDSNAFAGRTWYRLKQEDRDGRSTYSVVRLVTGDASTAVVLKAWPLPARDFFVSATGVKRDLLQIFDAGGRLVKQYNLKENEVVSVSGLMPGTYILRLRDQKDLVQKVVVQ